MAKKDKDSVYKVVEVVGTSRKSWAEAGRKAVETAGPGTLSRSADSRGREKWTWQLKMKGPSVPRAGGLVFQVRR